MNQSLGKYFALFKTEFFSVTIFSIGTNLLMLVPTLYMLQLYDRVLTGKNELTLYALTLITCFLFLVMAFCEWMRSLIVIKAGVKFDQLLGDKVFALGFASIGGAQQFRAHEAMQDLTSIRQFMTGNGLFAFFDVPWTVLYIAVLFIIHPMLGMIAIAFCTIQFGLGIWNQHSSEQPLQQASTATQINQRFLQNKARNIETLYVMGMISNLFLRWQAMQHRWSLLDSHAISIQTRNQAVNKFVRYTMQSLILAAAALLAIQGKVSIGSMIAANVLIARALQPFDVIVGTWKQYIQARQSVSRLNALLESEQTDEVSAGKLEIKGHVTLKNIGVRLENPSRMLLNSISLDIHPGQILTIMGPSGSGKTTLARCLAGVCQWQAGEFLLDGVAVEHFSLEQRAISLGYLPQDIELIEGTIADNIARFELTDSSDVITAAKAAGIHENILRLPNGYDTRIGESVFILSGGQRQLLGLARAIYREPALLVLDEPNSHLDEYGEANLLATLTDLKNKGKSIVLISHRSSILKISDQLLIMNNGQITHSGPRDIVAAELNNARQLSATRAA